MKFQMPLTVAKIFDIYYPENNKCRQILVEHSYLVAKKALEIASFHPSWSLDLSFIEEAAWVHDIGVNACQAPSIACYGTEPYIKHGIIGSERLRAENMPRHALVAERHTGTGLSLERILEKGWDLPHREFMPISLEEIIICVADKFFSKTDPSREKNLDEILEGLAHFHEEDVLRFISWYKMLFLRDIKEEQIQR